MKELTGDIWKYYDRGAWACVTTNGFVKQNGECVMGAGIAKQAKQRFPKLAKELGAKLTTSGNHVYAFPEYCLYSFPVKEAWWEPAQPDLIVASCKELRTLIADVAGVKYSVVMPRPGCGNGHLIWDPDVKTIVEHHLGELVIIVDRVATPA